MALRVQWPVGVSWLANLDSSVFSALWHFNPTSPVPLGWIISLPTTVRNHQIAILPSRYLRVAFASSACSATITFPHRMLAIRGGVGSWRSVGSRSAATAPGGALGMVRQGGK